MSQPRTMNPDELQGLQVIDSEGSKVGKVDTIFLDVETNKPEWAAVKTGMFAGKTTLVPLVNASTSGDELSVPYTKDAIKDAPHHDPDVELSTTDEAELFSHYGIPFGGDTVTADTGQMSQGTSAAGNGTVGRDTSETNTVGRGTSETGTVGHDTSGPNTDDAMTRSEERLHVGTEQVATGQARLRKYIVSDTVNQTVPVSHEEVRVVREPITDANRGDALSGGDLTEEEHEVTLHAERAVVAKETVPVERVRLDTETVTGQQDVSAEVRKEQIEEISDDADIRGK
jgi:uncharacterized protein (TIGR02271 family)